MAPPPGTSLAPKGRAAARVEGFAKASVRVPGTGGLRASWRRGETPSALPDVRRRPLSACALGCRPGGPLRPRKPPGSGGLHASMAYVHPQKVPARAGWQRGRGAKGGLLVREIVFDASLQTCVSSAV